MSSTTRPTMETEGVEMFTKDSTSDTDHTLWDDIVRAVCLICGKLTRPHKPEEVPLCEKCSNHDSEAAD